MERGYCQRSMRVSDFREVALFAIISIGYLSANGQSIAPSRPDGWAKRVELGSLENSYEINDILFRSEQPSRGNMIALDSAGMKTLVNLRNVRKDNYKARN